MLNDLRNLAEEKEIKFNQEQYDKDLEFIKTSVKFLMARDIWGNNGSYAVFVGTDEQFLKGISLFEEAIKLSKLNQ